MKQCVEVLVRVSERELTAEEAAQYRTTATAIRSMASKLGTELIKVSAGLIHLGYPQFLTTTIHLLNMMLLPL